MKKYSLLIDIVLLFGLGVISLVAIAPAALVMPNSLQMFILAIVLGLMATFLVFLWRETPSDEREAQNMAFASRAAYIVGCGILIIAMIIKSLNHELGPVEPLTLLAMIATKILVQRQKDDH